DQFVRGVSQAEAEAIAGTPLAQGGWFYPLGGAIDPASLCRAQIAAARALPGAQIDVRYGVSVGRIERDDDGGLWRIYDDADALVTQAGVVV
ncbi:FAD-dependent oxidoreductase, partial [Paraburkholderia sp. SIMBA_030]